MKDLNERVYDEEKNVNVIPTDWSGVQAIDASVAGGWYNDYAAGMRWNEPFRAYSDARALREQRLMAQAYGQAFPLNNDKMVRQDAAEEVKTRRESTLISAAEESTRIGTSPDTVAELLKTPSDTEDKELERVALEILAAENPTEEALETNEKNRLAAFDESLYAMQSFDHYWTQSEIMQKYLDAAEEDYNNTGILNKGLYLAAEILIPAYKNLKVKIKNPLDTPAHFWATSTRQDQYKFMWDAAGKLSPEDFDSLCAYVYKTLDEMTDDPYVAKDFFANVLTGPHAQDDIDAGIDLGAAVFGWSRIFKNMRRASKDITAAKKAKNTERIIEETEEAIAVKNGVDTAKDLPEDAIKAMNQAGKTKRLTAAALATEGVTDATIAERLIQNTSDTALLPHADTLVPLGDKALMPATINQDALSTASGILYSSTVHPEAFTEAQKLEYMDKFKKEFAKEVRKNNKNTGVRGNISFEETDTGRIKARADIGTGSDNILPFVNQKAAEDAAKSYRLLPGEYVTWQDVDGWWLRVEKDVDDTGYVFKEWNGEFSAGPWKKYFTSRLWTPDEFHAQDVAYSTGKAGRQQAMMAEANKMFKGLSKDDEKALDAILAQEKQAGERFDSAYLKDDLNANDKVIEAHKQYYQISDAVRLSKNTHARKYLERGGYKDIFTGGEDHYIAKHIEGLPKEVYKNNLFKDTETGLLTTLDEEQWKALVKEKDYAMVRLLEPMTEYTEDGNLIMTRFLIGPRESMKVKDLPLDVIGFREEGSILYPEHLLYAKQPVTWSDRYMFMATGFADMDLAKINKQVKEINNTLPIYRDYKTGRIDVTTAGIRLNESTAGNEFFKVGGLEDFEKYIRTKDNPTGLIQDWKYDFEVLRSGEESKQFGRLRAEGFMPSFETSKDEIEDMINLEIASNWRRKKTRLTDYEGAAVPTLNARRTVLANINNMVNMDTMRDYVEYYGREFRNLYGDIIKPGYMNLSDEELLRTQDALIEPSRGLNRRKYEAARNMQDHFKLVADSMTDWDKQWAATMKHWAEIVGDSEFAKNFTSLQRGGRLFEAIEKIPEPSQALKTIGYFSQMGMWNIRQLPMQALGTVNTLLMSPVQGMRMLGKISPAIAVIAAKDEKQLAKAIKALRFHGDLGAEEAKGLAEYLRRVALDTTEQRLSQYASNLGFQGFAKSNTMFFRMGEKMNAITAAGTAYLEYVAEHPEKLGKVLSNEDYIKILGRQDDLFLNMTKPNDSLLQKGALTRAAAQYTAFAMRSLEACLGKHLTGSEKARFILGNAALWGYAGLTGFNGYNLYSWMNDNGVDSEWAETFRSGLVGALARNVLGIEDVDFSEFGIQLFGEGWTGRIGDVIDDGTIDVLSMIPSTQVFGIAKDLPDSMRVALEIVKDTVLPSRTDTDLISHVFALATNNTPAAISRYTQAWLAVKTGNLIDKNGNVVRKDMDAKGALMHALGFKESEGVLREIYYEMDRDVEKRKKELVKDLTPLWNNYAQTHSDSARQTFENTYALMLKSYDDFNERNEFAKAVLAMQKKGNRLTTLIDDQINYAIKRGRVTFKEAEQSNKIRGK